MQWFLRLSEDYGVVRLSESDSDNLDDGKRDGHGPRTPPTLNSLFDDLTVEMEVDSFAATPIASSTLPTQTTLEPLTQPPSKRTYSSISSPSDESGGESDSHEGKLLARRLAFAPKPGSSWAMQKALRDNAKKSAVIPAKTKLVTFRQKILVEDPRAEFQDSNLLRVRCSACAEWVSMRVLYDVRHWKIHRKTGKCTKNRSTGFSTQSLLTLGFGGQSKPKEYVGTRSVPCPGLSRHSDHRIDRYMSRTSVNGGGAPSRQTIAAGLFQIDNLSWKDLATVKQRMILRREEMLYIWKISRAAQSIFSAACEMTVHASPTATPRPCSKCQALYTVHKFLVALNRPMPNEADMRFVPKAYRSADLGKIYLKYQGVRELVEKDDGHSPWLRFAQGVVGGTYTSETLLGMVEAFVIKADRMRKGKSLRNMKYSDAFNTFSNLLASTSTRAYQTFRRHFGGRSMSSIRKIRAKMPKFQPGLSAHNVLLAEAILKKYDYSGPLALSWDDTDLEPAISIFQESKGVCVVIGAIGGELRVESYNDIERVLDNARLNQASKLRIWLLTIPLPKIPPILVAAVARGPSENAQALYDMHAKLADLLHEQGIHPVSLASDGTEVERQTQHLISQSTPSHHVYSVGNTFLGAVGHITLRIPLFQGLYPMITVQDSKHALKTARNQIFTGARILVLHGKMNPCDRIRRYRGRKMWFTICT